MNIKDIRELINLIKESDIDELELERSGVRIRLKRNLKNKLKPLENNKLDGEHLSELRDKPSSTKPVENEAEKHIFKAPIVGTFYIAPKPDEDPFVKIGDQVSLGTVLCVIESMKIFNQIECDVEGDITKILVENGQPVEYGQPLYEILLAN